MKKLLIFIFLFVAVIAYGQKSARQVGVVDEYNITSYPLYGGAVSESDTVDLTQPGFVRADAAGAVTAACVGNGVGNQITLNLVAGEFFPCMVVRVYDTGTDAITMHWFY